jgi:hypothetical protein
VDLRQNKRYRLSAPVSFFWQSREGSVGAGEGHTRDISITGVFILTAGLVPEGSLIRLDVSLPPLHGKGQRVHLHTEGRVLRTEDDGFAAIADMGFRMDFAGTDRSRKDTTNVHKNEDKKKSDTLVQGWVS